MKLFSTVFGVFEGDEEHEPVCLDSYITQKGFLQKLESPYVRELLDSLEIATTHPQNYMEALDANEDGKLSVTELVKGLLRLRGGVEKADIVASLMAARDMQKSLQSVEGVLAKTSTAFAGTPTGNLMAPRMSFGAARPPLLAQSGQEEQEDVLA